MIKLKGYRVVRWDRVWKSSEAESHYQVITFGVLINLKCL
ncbi:hypothetical protein F383_22588 [Gossypium arboreum]|uniref:Uncharacterized protein n=1 Tax=Gossypium arboreum TaxID=29729 RepID=A0A0B0NYY7_GOSAR|nr:hypothetical protein F383_22588 [Gossypium arboreum]